MAESTAPAPTSSRRRRHARRPLVVGAAIALAGLVAVGLLISLVFDGKPATWATQEPTESSRPTSATAERPAGPPGTPSRPASEKPVIEPEVRDAEVLDVLRASFGDSVTAVEIQASGNNFIRLDVTTAYAFSSDDAAAALDVAEAAASCQVLVDAYGTLTIAAYVWPADGAVYMTRATAVWENGALVRPVDTYTDSALR